MCDATENEERMAISLMLNGTDLSLLTRKGHGTTTFVQGITSFHFGSTPRTSILSSLPSAILCHFQVPGYRRARERDISVPILRVEDDEAAAPAAS